MLQGVSFERLHGFIEGVGPTVTSVSSTKANGSYKAGSNLLVQVSFSEAVTVAGVPQRREHLAGHEGA